MCNFGVLTFKRMWTKLRRCREEHDEDDPGPGDQALGGKAEGLGNVQSGEEKVEVGHDGALEISDRPSLRGRQGEIPVLYPAFHHPTAVSK